MNKLLLVFVIIFSPGLFAEQCQIRLKNELHHSHDYVEIVLENGQIAKLYQDNHLVIDNKEYPLTSEQKVVLKDYREMVVSGINQYQQLTSGYIEQIDSIIDELSSVLGDSNNLDALKTKMHSFWEQASADYYQDGQFVMGSSAFTQLDELWNKMKAFFDQEAMADLWATFSEGVGKLSELSFSEFASLIQELNNKIYQHWQQFSEKKEFQQKQLCDSFNQLIDQEESLHESIPELKNYQVFTI